MPKKRQLRQNDVKPKNLLIAETKTLDELGLSYSQISRQLGISRQYVAHLIHEDLPEEWERFRATMKRNWFASNADLMMRTDAYLEANMDTARYSDVVFLKKVLGEQQFPEDRRPAQSINLNQNKVSITFESLSNDELATIAGGAGTPSNGEAGTPPSRIED